MNKKKIFLIIGLAFAVRLLALFLLGRHSAPETWEYNEIALNIAHRHEYVMQWFNTEHRAHAYPLYPMLCAVSHMLTGENYFILELLHVGVSAITCYLIYLIARRIFDERVALVSAALTALHPGLIVYSTKIHELTFVVFLVSLIFWQMVSSDPRRIRNALIFGALMGLATLTRPTLIAFLPAYLVWLSSSLRGWHDVSRRFLAASLIMVIVILPWTVRNFLIFKRPIFITTNSAELFWRGNNPNASGTALTADGRGIIDTAGEEFVKKVYSMSEIEQYDFFNSEAIKFIRSNPRLFAALYIKKFFYFWWFSPQTGMLYPGAWTAIYKIYYSVILLFFIAGLSLSIVRLSRPQKAYLLPLVLFLFLIPALHSLYYVEVRHRWAIEPFMMIFCAYTIDQLINRNVLLTNRKGPE